MYSGLSNKMDRVQLAELTAFVAVAEHLNFTKAAVRLGLSLPTVSHTIRTLEERLEVRLFNRTTRSVALTEAGERLLAEIQPILAGLDHALESVDLFRDKPRGTLRLAVSRLFATRVLTPLIEPFLAEYPEIHLELAIDDTNSDIVSNRFDAGIRAGHRVERDMKIIRVLDDLRLFAVAAPAYLARHPPPATPKDLHGHNCLRYRIPWDGSTQPWIFDKGRQHIEVAVDGSFTVNDIDILLSATLDGVGISYQLEPIVEPYLAEGRLVHLFPDWEYLLPGVFLYHPSRRQTPMPLLVFLNFIKKWRSSLRTALTTAEAGSSPART